MRLQPMERKILYLAAAYCAVAMALIQAYTRGTEKFWWLAVSLALVGAFVALTWRTNRMFAGIGAILCVYGPAWGRYVQSIERSPGAVLGCRIWVDRGRFGGAPAR